MKDTLENTRTLNLTSHVCVGGSTHDQTPAEHGGKLVCVGQLVLRTLCDGTQASNSCAPHPTRLAPFDRCGYYFKRSINDTCKTPQID